MDTYQFSKVYKATCVAYSPGSTFIATALLGKVQVRSTSSLECIRTWTCEPPAGSSASSTQEVAIEHLAWSPGGNCISALCITTGVVWVFDLAQDDVVARIGGDIVRADWGEEDLLTQSKRGIALYNLSSERNRFIQNVQGGYAWSPDRSYLAVSERHQGKQYVGIYDKESLIRHFEVLAAETSSLSWSPCGKWLAVSDLSLSYSIHFYSPVGAHVGTFAQDPSSASVHDLAQSIRHSVWSPNGRHIAIGDSGGLVQVIESENWKSIASLRGYQAISICEPPLPPRSGGEAGIVQFPRGAVASSSAAIHWLGFSSDGTVLYFGQDSVLHVYAFLLDPGSSTPDIEATVTITFNAHIKSVQCCPTSNRVAVATRTKFLYLYDGLGVEGVAIQEADAFAAINVQWAPDGGSAAVCDRSSFCLVYEDGSNITVDDENWDEM